MTVSREDSELESVLAIERAGSGEFENVDDDIERSILEHWIEELTPRPGPNYYAHNAHRVYCEKNSDLLVRLQERLNAL